MPGLQVHPAAALFPMLSDADLGELADDIGKHGLLHPLVVWERDDGTRVLVDGRNRLAALDLLGIEPDDEHITTREFSGEEAAIAFVVAVNMRRRHMTTTERAFIAAELSKLSTPGRPETASRDAVSQDQAAKAMGVGRSTVQRAKKVTEQGTPALVDATKQGRVGLRTAAKATKLPPEQQKQVAETGRLPEEKPPTSAPEKPLSRLVSGFDMVSAAHAHEARAEAIRFAFGRLEDEAAGIAGELADGGYEDGSDEVLLVAAHVLVRRLSMAMSKLGLSTTALAQEAFAITTEEAVRAAGRGDIDR